MNKRFALGAIFFCMLAIGVAYASAFLPGGPPRAAPWVVAIATAGVMVAVLVLGAARGSGRLHPALVAVFGATFVIVSAGFCLALAAPPVTAASRMWLGLPAGAALIMYVVGLLPLLILPVAYALTFESTTLSDDELDSLRLRLRALRASAGE